MTPLGALTRISHEVQAEPLIWRSEWMRAVQWGWRGARALVAANLGHGAAACGADGAVCRGVQKAARR
jgi:hypothetical protein